MCNGDWSHWPAPAKLNLFLHIVGRRADGYHLLQTVFQLLDWGDEVSLRVRNDGRIERHTGPHGVAESDDLSVRAALALQRFTGTALGADIAVTKRIPLGGGFGGGSSDAASVLVALNWLWKTGLNAGELAAIGLTLGADVPVFIAGNSAFAEGVGERLTPMTLPLRHYLLLDPGVHVPTPELFQAPELTRNDPPITMSDFLRDSASNNAFEKVLRARSARVDAAMNALAVHGRAQLTGSGGGCFVAFETADGAQKARAEMASDWLVWCVQGVDESPLSLTLRRRYTAQKQTQA